MVKVKLSLCKADTWWEIKLHSLNFCTKQCRWSTSCPGGFIQYKAAQNMIVLVNPYMQDTYHYFNICQFYGSLLSLMV